MDVKIEESWKEVLKDEFTKDYFLQIVTFIKTEKAAGKIIYPPGSLMFNAFNKTPFDKVKVVLLGQDPYHNPGQAQGLSFSVPNGVGKPPSLINIFKELQSDLGIVPSTVRKNEPGSHSKIGWLNFTDAVIKKISEEKKGVVFLLWGKFAQDKQALIDETKHHVLKAAHPSPFSADKGFFGCKHFSKANEFLMQEGLQPIDWKLN